MNDRSAQRMAMLQEALASGGTLHLRDAAELCGVSEMTIRRDLSTQPSAISLLGGRLVMASCPGEPLSGQTAPLPTGRQLYRRGRHAVYRLRLDVDSTAQPAKPFS